MSINFISPNIQHILLNVLDVYITWFLIYQLLKLIKTNVRAIQLVKGALLIYFLNTFSQFFALEMLTDLTNEIITWGILAIIIVFQPEIRNGLEHLGRNSAIKRAGRDTNEGDWVSSLCFALNTLSDEKTGALVVIEQQITLDEFIIPAIPLQAIITPQLIRTIFATNTPLHDGAVFIRDNHVHCAGAILPSTSQETIEGDLGTRHRAALGISEVSDAITLVVSEETGLFSLTYKGELERFDTIKSLEKQLRRYFIVKA